MLIDAQGQLRAIRASRPYRMFDAARRLARRARA
jgi:hypothetical protein